MVFTTTKPTGKILSASFSSAGGQNLEMPDNKFINAFRWRKGKAVSKTKLNQLKKIALERYTPLRGRFGGVGNRNPGTFGSFGYKRT